MTKVAMRRYLEEWGWTASRRGCVWMRDPKGWQLDEMRITEAYELQQLREAFLPLADLRPPHASR
jgi:hypothetical protein